MRGYLTNIFGKCESLYVYVCFKKMQLNFDSKKIKDIGFKIEKNMTDDFNKDTGRIIPSTFYEGKPIDKYTSEEVNYFKERDKYVNEHKNRYINLYEKELSVYGFEVKFVN